MPFKQSCCFFILLGIFSCLGGKVFADDDPSALIVRANTLYSESKFERAVDYYQDAIAAGLDNGHVYYNLGNALYRLGKFGPAIAAYRKALLQFPRDPDIIANLTLARKKVKDFVPSAEGMSINKLLYIANNFSKEELIFLTLFLYLLFWLSYITMTVRKNNTTSFICAMALLLLIACGGSLLFSRPGRDGQAVFALRQKISSGVMIKPEVNVYSGDGSHYQVVFILHEGTEVELGEERGNWTQILLPEGRQGWVTKENIERI